MLLFVDLLDGYSVPRQCLLLLVEPVPEFFQRLAAWEAVPLPSSGVLFLRLLSRLLVQGAVFGFEVDNVLPRLDLGVAVADVFQVLVILRVERFAN